MPTKPHQGLLDRDLSKASATEFIRLASPLLQEVVNNGTLVFLRCWDSSTGDPNENVAPLILYLHMVEFTDAIDLLVQSACMTPALPLLRSSFEALLQLEYIVEDSSQSRSRSLSWLSGYASSQLELLEYMDPSSKRGQPVAAHLAADKAPKLLLSLAREQLEGASMWRQTACELDALHLRALPNTEELAKRLRRYAQYTLLYRRWSSIGHARDLSHFIARDSAGHSGVRRLRDPREAQRVAVLAVYFMCEATTAMLGHFRPGEERSHLEWFKREIGHGLDTLANLDIEFTGG